MTTFAKLLQQRGHAKKFHSFQKLMQYRVRKVLMVCSLYDSFIFEEDGQLYEKLYSEHHNLSLITVPNLVRVSSGREALEMIDDDVDLIITSLNPGDMPALELAQRVSEMGAEIPVVLLSYDERGLQQMAARFDLSVFEKVFLWQGDFRIIIAIIKYVEDSRNVEHDTKTVGVQSIILIEDSIHFYSSYLPILYGQLFHHSLSLISEGVNASQRFLRMRARPKILLASTYEEAWDYYLTYHRSIMGIISDIKFPRGGFIDDEAGLRFARRAKQSNPDIPILLQSNSPEYREEAQSLGTTFLYKSSPTLLRELQYFMKRYFSFGDFVFTTPAGAEVSRARDLKSFEQKLRQIPAESVVYHFERNHFSNWLKARTEFWLAHRLTSTRLSTTETAEDIRKSLLAGLKAWKGERSRGAIVDFDPENFDAGSFCRIGQGSLGGKARGLGFVVSLLSDFNIADCFEGVQIGVPEAVVLATDTFDRFLDENGLREFALHCEDDEDLYHQFEQGDFPGEILRLLLAYIDQADYPVAIRSSSLLEDSRYLPFAGVYDTHMLANNSRDRGLRREQFLSTIKRVYASTYSQQSKAYFRSTPYRLEEEKMAVIVQKLVGSTHGDLFYPNFSGVLRSHNYYPHAPLKTEDGIATVGLGLGETVVSGRKALQFCPVYPRHSQFGGVDDILSKAQTKFYALTLPAASDEETASMELKLLDIDEAEEHGTLKAICSTYSPENDAIYDGMRRNGARIVTFAPILKQKTFPLAEILKLIGDMGQWSMNSPVEIEFAVNLSSRGKSEFGFLQMRPMVAGHELEELSFDDIDDSELICKSARALGNALVDDVFDLIFVLPEEFQRAKSRQVAEEVAMYNQELEQEGRPYILVGLGRWGTSDPWLGIPVTWDEVTGARVIVEAGFKDMAVEPSQGSHFFQNLSSFGTGYLTIGDRQEGEWLDWEWLQSQEGESEREYTRHLRFEEPLVAKMNGHHGWGCISRPAAPE